MRSVLSLLSRRDSVVLCCVGRLRVETRGGLGQEDRWSSFRGVEGVRTRSKMFRVPGPGCGGAKILGGLPRWNEEYTERGWVGWAYLPASWRVSLSRNGSVCMRSGGAARRQCFWSVFPSSWTAPQFWAPATKMARPFMLQMILPLAKGAPG